MAAETITIPSRFNGPPDSGNGGYTCGLVGKAVGAAAAEVTLRSPPPLDRPLAVERTGEGVVVRDGETIVAEGRQVSLALDPPRPVALADAARAGNAGPFLDAARHPFPSCFVCGPTRPEGDGLRIFAGPSGDGGAFAAAWTPPESLAGPDGRVADEVVWAALDCPSSAPVANDPDSPGYLPIVLARLAVRIDEPVLAGRPHVVMAWKLAVEGRKRQAGAALYTAEGDLCAVARALWIELRPSAEGAP